MVISRITVLVIAAAFAVAAAGNCTYDVSPPAATVGENFTLQCNLDGCFDTKHYWCLWNDTECTSLGKIGVFFINDSVSIDEIGGRHYECHCPSNRSICKNYIIAVTPVVHLSLTTEVARVGSSVNVTCTAESYPPATSVENYQMEHPRDIDISQTLVTQERGVVHKIPVATKELDEGIYECTVTLKLRGYTNPIQSEKYEVNLQVYEPPVIVTVNSVSTPGLTVIMCIIESTEKQVPMEIWVDWTNSSGHPLLSDHTTAQIGNVFYLLLNHTTAVEYTCNLYSNYSHGKPEDTATTKEMKNCQNVTEPEPLKPNTDNYRTVAIVMCILFVLTLIMLVMSLLFICKYTIKHGTSDTNAYSLPSNAESKTEGKTQHFEEKEDVNTNDNDGENNVSINVLTNRATLTSIPALSPPEVGTEAPDASSPTPLQHHTIQINCSKEYDTGDDTVKESTDENDPAGKTEQSKSKLTPQNVKQSYVTFQLDDTSTPDKFYNQTHVPDPKEPISVTKCERSQSNPLWMSSLKRRSKQLQGKESEMAPLSPPYGSKEYKTEDDTMKESADKNNAAKKTLDASDDEVFNEAHVADPNEPTVTKRERSGSIPSSWLSSLKRRSKHHDDDADSSENALILPDTVVSSRRS